MVMLKAQMPQSQGLKVKISKQIALLKMKL